LEQFKPERGVQRLHLRLNIYGMDIAHVWYEAAGKDVMSGIRLLKFLFMKGKTMTTPSNTPRANEATTTTGPSSSSMGTLRDQAQEAGRDVAHRVQQVGEEIAEKAQHLKQHGREIASEYYQQGREQAAIWEHQLEEQIREKPIQSLLIAGGIGLLLGLLCRR
jgi:ElaB/YqjD/DUF883 family membrane-anchored ribosome-binding protein